jgi:prefoldin subunit 5
MLKILLVAFASLSIGAGAISYVNYMNNQLIEDKFEYLQRDVKQLTRKIRELNSQIDTQVNTSSNRESSTLIHIVKETRVNPNNDYSDSTVTQSSDAIVELRKRQAKEKSLKKHLGKATATN